MAGKVNLLFNMETTSTEKKKRSWEWLYLFLIALLLCSNGVFTWMWWKEKNNLQIITIEKETAKHDAETVKEELNDLQSQYAGLQVNNKKIQAEIDTKREEIEALQQEFEKHKDDSYIITKLKRETQTLRNIMQHFVHQIDSLNTLNKVVINERETVKKELGSEKEKNTLLSKEKEDLQNTVNIASLLKANALSASGVIIKKAGKKESTTQKAKHCNKIKIAFTLGENSVAKKGERILYARIVSPDGKELTPLDDSTHVFSFGKSHGYWAARKNINYSNENTDVVLYAEPKPGESFTKGKYLIEINTDGVTIGNTSLDLE